MKVGGGQMCLSRLTAVVWLLGLDSMMGAAPTLVMFVCLSIIRLLHCGRSWGRISMVKLQVMRADFQCLCHLMAVE